MVTQRKRPMHLLGKSNFDLPYPSPFVVWQFAVARWHRADLLHSQILKSCRNLAEVSAGMTTSCVPNESLSVSSLTRSRVLCIEKVLIRKQERFVSRDIDFEAGAIAFATPALVFVLFRRRA